MEPLLALGCRDLVERIDRVKADDPTVERTPRRAAAGRGRNLRWRPRPEAAGGSRKVGRLDVCLAPAGITGGDGTTSRRPLCRMGPLDWETIPCKPLSAQAPF
jgi:hypothetical protein